MKPFIAALAVVVLAIGSASAGKPGHNSGGHRSHNGNGYSGTKVHSGNYHLTYGKKFRGGWYYPGKYHHHWSYQCYWPKYGCTCYWCPSTRCYYYWYAPAGCYYPVSYIQTAKPVFASEAEGDDGPPAGVPGLPE